MTLDYHPEHPSLHTPRRSSPPTTGAQEAELALTSEKVGDERLYRIAGATKHRASAGAAKRKSRKAKAKHEG